MINVLYIYNYNENRTNEKLNEICTGYIDTIIYINFSLLW